VKVISGKRGNLARKLPHQSDSALDKRKGRREIKEVRAIPSVETLVTKGEDFFGIYGANPRLDGMKRVQKTHGPQTLNLILNGLGRNI